MNYWYTEQLESPENYVEWKQLMTNSMYYIILFVHHSWNDCRILKITEIKNKLMVARGWGMGGKGQREVNVATKGQHEGSLWRKCSLSWLQ